MAKWISEESLKKLSDKELDVLEKNTNEKKYHLDFDTSINLISQEKQRRLTIKPIKEPRKKTGGAGGGFNSLVFSDLDEDKALSLLAENFKKLQLANELEFAQKRKEKITIARNQTLSDLWRIYVGCAFSSTEKSSEGLSFDLFVNGNNELLDLESVIKNNADSDWIDGLLKESGMSRYGKKELKLFNLPISNFCKLATQKCF